MSEALSVKSLRRTSQTFTFRGLWSRVTETKLKNIIQQKRAFRGYWCQECKVRGPCCQRRGQLTLSGAWSRWHQVSAGSKQPRGAAGEGPYRLYRSRTHLFSTVRSARLALADGGSIPAPLLECSMTYLSQSFSTWALLWCHGTG